LPRIDPRYAHSVHVYRIVPAKQSDKKENQMLVDADGYAHGAYGDGVFLIRPDGYVGYAAPSDGGTSGLNRYLGRFFG
jgi:hypothetical protein